MLKNVSYEKYVKFEENVQLKPLMFFWLYKLLRIIVILSFDKTYIFFL